MKPLFTTQPRRPTERRIVELTHFHLFCGLGGGASGFNASRARVGKMRGKFRCIGGVDVDAAGIRDFETLTNSKGTVLDLFDREQYKAFHEENPPKDWKEATPEDIRAAAGFEYPNIVFFSAPCKGFSGLLSESKSKSAKYQALNKLTLRGIRLMLDAFKAEPPKLVIFENVPRIATRGRKLLDKIVALLKAHGYAVAETKHNCGELGALAQSRERFLLVARHEKTVKPFLYVPQKHKLRAVGEVLEKLPMPGDPVAGPMHRIPRLSWKTWVRLAFVEPGKDWRSLNRLRVQDGFLQDYLLIPEGSFQNQFGVNDWNEPSGTVTTKNQAHTGCKAVADPRGSDLRNCSFGVTPFGDAANAVTSKNHPSTGCRAVADPRVADYRDDYCGVIPFDKPSGAVSGRGTPTNGKYSVNDPRFDGHAFGQYGVREFDEPTGTIAGQQSPGQGGYSVQDPRTNGNKNTHASYYRIVRYGEASKTITGSDHVSGGGLLVEDTRIDGVRHNNVHKVISFKSPSATVTAGGGPTVGGLCVEDLRPHNGKGFGKFGIQKYDKEANTVIGSDSFPLRGGAVADPRPKEGPVFSKFMVTPFDGPTGTVIGGDDTGAYAVRDPRPAGMEGRTAYLTANPYGVVPMDAPCGAIPGSACHDNGPWSVVDFRLPEPNEKLVCVIITEAGAWHRPFTTLELAALQGLFVPEEHFQRNADGSWTCLKPFVLDGQSDSAWRERIGNAVPPPAARAIARQMGRTLLNAMSGSAVQLELGRVWVRRRDGVRKTTLREAVP